MSKWRWSVKSRDKLDSCHPDLVAACDRALSKSPFDLVILSGHRGEVEQNNAFRNKASTKQFPDSKHNMMPSLAVDIAPYPINWDTRDPRWHYLAGLMLGSFSSKGRLKLVWGGNWDGDATLLTDQKLIDLPHFEVVRL